MCPIIGVRYHLRGANFDLCQQEFDKLDEEEKAAYEPLASPSASSRPALVSCVEWVRSDAALGRAHDEVSARILRRIVSSDGVAASAWVAFVDSIEAGDATRSIDDASP